MGKKNPETQTQPVDFIDLECNKKNVNQLW